MRIRLATESDIAALARVHVASWQAVYRGIMPDSVLDGLTQTQFEASWRERMTITSRTNLVCERGHTVVGFAAFGSTRDRDQDPAITAELYAIYVESAYWSQGCGHALWQRVQEALMASTYELATLWVLAANVRARRFYEREGFTLEEGMSKVEERAGVKLPEVRYRKVLKDGF